MTDASLDMARLEDDFAADGFAVARGYCDASEVAELNRTIDAVVARLPSLPGDVAFYEVADEPESIMRLQLLEQHDEQLRQLFLSDRMAGLARRLLADEVTPIALEWFAKPPRIGKLTPPHQDQYWWHLEPCSGVTLWLSLDHIDESNGCIRYVPGSHLLPLRTHGEMKVLGFSKGILDFGDADLEAERAVVTQPGDLIAHHAGIVHRADPNPTTRPRRALGMVYFAASAKRPA